MITFRHLSLFSVLIASFAISGIAMAQQDIPLTTTSAAPTTTNTTTIGVGHGVWTVNVPNDEPLVAWVAESIVTPSGQFAKTYVLVQSSEGVWVKLTPCDDIAITCDSVLMRVDNVVQGKQFYLGDS